MRRELRRLGRTSPRKIWLAAKNFAKTVWDPTRSDIEHGIHALVYEALSNAPPAREAEVARENPELAALFHEGYDPALDTAQLVSPTGRRAARTRVSSAPTRSIRATISSRFRARRTGSNPNSGTRTGCTTCSPSCSIAMRARSRSADRGLLARPRARDRRARARDGALGAALAHGAAPARSSSPQSASRRNGCAAASRLRGYAAHRLEDWMDRLVSEVRSRVLAMV